MGVFAIRLLPGNDLKREIEAMVARHQVKAGWVITCVGSLTQYCLRFANQRTATTGTGHFEILSLVGTLTIHGLHLHMSLGDHNGTTLGGHLMEGCIVYTTAELVIETDDAFVFEREVDDTTGFKELKIVSATVR